MTASHNGKGLIVTADDFGIAPQVNEAVERAHREGILTCASLMVTGAAAADAVARARSMPTLGVGLHLVLIEGKPVLPPAHIPALVRTDGMFRNDMVRASFGMALLPKVKRQLADEIEAQFEAFAATGLKLDHVNAHKHFHLHPTIGRLVVEIGRKYGMESVRAPCEPLAVLKAVEPEAQGGEIERFCGNRLKDRLWAAGIWSPDQVFGLCWTGAMNTRRIAGLLKNLPKGVSEIYAHPATHAYPGSTAGYRYADELCALTAAQTIEAARALSLGSFRDFAKA
jgi:hopanoid biosynthesis associated protein HpnK